MIRSLEELDAEIKAGRIPEDEYFEPLLGGIIGWDAERNEPIRRVEGYIGRTSRRTIGCWFAEVMEPCQEGKVK